MAIANILLVDDEVPFLETMTKRLTKRDYEITSAETGAEALDKLNMDQSIDVVILDVKMPGMDGIETLKEIKRSHPLVEVIMLTAYATVESGIIGMKIGAFDYLMKPCDMDILIAKVDKAVTKKKAHEKDVIKAGIMEIVARRA
jgi:DNA-binding response OmpR family regulator